jgi:hypothetical protein
MNPAVQERNTMLSYHRAIGRALLVALTSALTISVAAPAQAHRRDFAFTYEWWTPAVGEKEIESYSTYNADTKNFDGAVEFETGLTERLGLGVYYLYSKDNGESLKGEGYKIESRYRFGEFRRGKVLPAAYLEYEKENGETAEMEAKLLLTSYGTDPAGTKFALNLIAERELESGADYEYGYALGYSRKGDARTRYGLELTGSLEENEHALGPVVAHQVNKNVRALLSTNFALTDKADTRLRFLVEYEWF